jgi:hypothetical protein
LVLDITLCGIWAGLPETWQPSCGGRGPTNICVRLFGVHRCLSASVLIRLLLPFLLSRTQPSTQQYSDNVIGPGSNYNDAYFEISYVRAYTTGGIVPTPTAVATPIAVADNGNGGGIQHFTSVITAAPSADGILRPSPLFFPGNGATSSLRLASWYYWVSALGVGVGIGVGMGIVGL